MKPNFTNHQNFSKIVMGLVIVLVVALIGFNIDTIREGLTTVLQLDSNTPIYTNCTQPTTCSTCINATIGDLSNVCYWNDKAKKCGSFKDPGYSKTCPDAIVGNCHQMTTCAACIRNGCTWSNVHSKCSKTPKDATYKTTCNNPGPEPNPGNCSYKLLTTDDVYVKV